MKRFHYGLTPALDAARREEEAAARGFVFSRQAALDAEARVADLGAAASAIRDRASMRAFVPLPVPVPVRAPVLTSQTFVDRERCLEVLAVREAQARKAATRAAWDRDAARRTYEARIRRRGAFEAHRARALASYERARELVEAAEFDEANASLGEAGPMSNGKHVA